MQDAELLVAIGVVLPLSFLIFLFQYRNKKHCKNKITSFSVEEAAKDLEDILYGDGEKHLNDGKTDDRIFEIGDSEIERPVIDTESREYYQNLGDNKLRQDEMAEMLRKDTETNIAKQLNFEHSKAGEQARRKQADKDAQNTHWLNKLKGYRIQRKIAKKIAQKNIQLDEEQIKKIKIRALAGKMR